MNEASGRTGAPRSTSDTCSASPGPSLPPGDSARTADTIRPPKEGMSSASPPTLAAPVHPNVSSSPYSACGEGGRPQEGCGQLERVLAQRRLASGAALSPSHIELTGARRSAHRRYATAHRPVVSP
eukprot:4707473-Pleurochrysis_carterae.AAC.1